MRDTPPTNVATGLPGLDDILAGGLPRGRFYLVEGDPGTGKTTLALQFLLEGAGRGERTLYVTLTETADELRAVARSHGWSLDGIDLSEIRPNGESGTGSGLYHSPPGRSGAERDHEDDLRGGEAHPPHAGRARFRDGDAGCNERPDAARVVPQPIGQARQG